jgi:hypothetical protein
MAADARKPALVTLPERRQQVIDRLTDDFARDILEVDDFEERVDQAHRASSIEALEKVVSDLTPLEASAPPLPPERAMELHAERVPAAALATNRAESRWLVAVMSGIERKGGWRVPQTMRVFCMMGGADIIVPPDLAVECDGIAIMGGFDQLDRAPAHVDPNSPLLRVTGVALMGGFTISTRLPGESARQAKKRKRRERRELERQQRRQLASGK